MKKIFITLFFVCCLGFSVDCYAQSYYRLPEETYQETLQYIQDSLLINQQLQNKVIELKKQQAELEQQVKTLEEQVIQLKQQQSDLKNSYKNNEDFLNQENLILKQQSESMKKKTKQTTLQRDTYGIICIILLGALAIK